MPRSESCPASTPQNREAIRRNTPAKHLRCDEAVFLRVKLTINFTLARFGNLASEGVYGIIIH